VPVKVQMSMDELYAPPPQFSYEIAGRAWGMARHKAARLLKANSFPMPVLAIGSRKVCTKAALFASLGIPLSELGTAAPQPAEIT
jgi:hypothetical protein